MGGGAERLPYLLATLSPRNCVACSASATMPPRAEHKKLF